VATAVRVQWCDTDQLANLRMRELSQFGQRPHQTRLRAGPNPFEVFEQSELVGKMCFQHAAHVVINRCYLAVQHLQYRLDTFMLRRMALGQTVSFRHAHADQLVVAYEQGFQRLLVGVGQLHQQPLPLR
jgi:hypothetical protein